jgi:type IV secretion system protein VirD4
MKKKYPFKKKYQTSSEITKRADYHTYQKDSYIQKGGIVLGLKKEGAIEKIYYEDDDVHTLCIGATRSGKSRTVVLQSIGTLALAGESMILSDPKGELYQYTYPFLESMGYEVICIICLDTHDLQNTSDSIKRT